MAEQTRARRSILAVPAGRPEMVAKALTLGADQIFFDLEDGTAPLARESARANIAKTIDGQGKSLFAPLVSIRINQVGSSDIEADLNLLSDGTALAIDSIIMPKVNSRAELEWIDSKLLAIESELGIDLGSIVIDAQIESAQGLINASEIATFPRVASLSFGPLDFLADLGVPTLEINQSHSELTSHALVSILIASRAAGKLAFDGPTVDYKNLEVFEKSAKSVYAMGFDGKWLIHPNQIAPCHSIFTPTQAEFASALKLLADYEAGTSAGIGAIQSSGIMVDAASIRMALVIKARGVAGNVC